jgi:hypothetical protein
MKKFLLEKIRLSWYFAGFFLVYFVLLFLLPREKFNTGALTLFSVNSFLYGFYISPILSGQKARIDELHKIVRAEANAIFSMVLDTKALPEELRNNLQEDFKEYMRNTIRGSRGTGQQTYETLITFCVRYKGEHKEEIEKLLKKLVDNQQNRTALRMQMNNKVFSNEWLIMIVLFSITLSFIMLIDSGGAVIYKVVTALLATGLSMLILGLLKLSTLTHKKAKQIWLPFEKLIDSHFYRID